MKLQIAKGIIIASLISASGNLMATPDLKETCIGSPWQVCLGTRIYTMADADQIRVQTTNGQTYNNIDISWTVDGNSRAPTVASKQNCTASTTTSLSGCTMYPASSGIFTGVYFNDATEGQYLNVTVRRKNSDGTYVNLVQTRVGPLVHQPA